MMAQFLIKFLEILPRPLLAAVTASMGLFYFVAGARRRKICLINLELCFPKKSYLNIRLLALKCFWQVGRGFGEAVSIWRVGRSLKPRMVVENIEILSDGASSGRGVLLVCPHYTTLEAVPWILSQHVNSLVMTYRPHDNAIIESILVERRSKFGTLLPVRDIRGMLRHLKAGEVVWFGPDQDMGTKGAVLSSFFGRPAWTVTTPARLTRISGCVPIFMQVCRKGEIYHVRYLPFPEGYPSCNEVSNAEVLNRLIVSAVSEWPSQYNWLHRRFKTNPDGSRHTLYRD